MSFDINVWLNEIIDKVKAAFGERLLFIGLQGSYNRCEATSDSDIDLVVIIDELTFNDIKIYKKIVAEMPYSNKACGFLHTQESPVRVLSLILKKFLFTLEKYCISVGFQNNK